MGKVIIVGGSFSGGILARKIAEELCRKMPVVERLGMMKERWNVSFTLGPSTSCWPKIWPIAVLFFGHPVCLV